MSAVVSSVGDVRDLPNTPAVRGKDLFAYDTIVDYEFAGIGAYYFGARYYDPEIGVWFSVDPMDQFWNAYAYCGGNSVNWIDPFGLEAGPGHKTGGGVPSGAEPIHQGGGGGGGYSGAGSSYGGSNGARYGMQGTGFALHSPYAGAAEAAKANEGSGISKSSGSGKLNARSGPRGNNPQTPASAPKLGGYQGGGAGGSGGMNAGAVVYQAGGSEGGVPNVGIPDNGLNLLRSSRFDANGNIQLNRRGMLGSFGVPILGGIVGAGVVVTVGTAVAIENTPAIFSYALRHRQAITAGAKKIGKNIGNLGPNPWLSLNAPTKSTVAAWGVLSGVNYLGNGGSEAQLINHSVAPADNTSVRW